MQYDNRWMWAVEEEGRRIAYEGRSVRTITVNTLIRLLKNMYKAVETILHNVEYYGVGSVVFTNLIPHRSLLDLIDTFTRGLEDLISSGEVHPNMPLMEFDRLNSPRITRFKDKLYVKTLIVVSVFDKTYTVFGPVWEPVNKSIFSVINSIVSCYHLLLELYERAESGRGILIGDDATEIAKRLTHVWNTMVNRNIEMNLYMKADSEVLFAMAYDNVFRARVGSAGEHMTNVYCGDKRLEYFDNDVEVVATLYVLLRDSVGCSIVENSVLVEGRTVFRLKTVDERVAEILSMVTSMDERIHSWAMAGYTLIKEKETIPNRWWLKSLGPTGVEKILIDSFSIVTSNPEASSVIASLPFEIVKDLSCFYLYAMLKSSEPGAKVDYSDELLVEIFKDELTVAENIVSRIFGVSYNDAGGYISRALSRFAKGMVDAEANSVWNYLSVFGVSDFWRKY